MVVCSAVQYRFLMGSLFSLMVNKLDDRILRGDACNWTDCFDYLTYQFKYSSQIAIDVQTVEAVSIFLTQISLFQNETR